MLLKHLHPPIVALFRIKMWPSNRFYFELRKQRKMKTLAEKKVNHWQFYYYYTTSYLLGPKVLNDQIRKSRNGMGIESYNSC